MRPPTRSHASAQVLRAGAPRAAGCLPPIAAAYASLYRATSSGPQWIRIGNPEFRQFCTMVRSTGDQPCGSPRGVADQSFSRNSARNSPAPANADSTGSRTVIRRSLLILSDLSWAAPF